MEEMVRESSLFEGLPLIQKIVNDDLALGLELALKNPRSSTSAQRKIFIFRPPNRLGLFGALAQAVRRNGKPA